VRTNFGAEDQAGFFVVMGGMVRPFLKTPARGAKTSIYLASSPDVEGVSGQFFANCKPKTANKLAYDTDMAARLWQVSADLVGLTAAIR
jgi:retinol dehydrogenase-14